MRFLEELDELLAVAGLGWIPGNLPEGNCTEPIQVRVPLTKWLCSKFVLKPTPQAPSPHSPVASSPSFAPRPCCRAFGTTPGSCRDTSSTPR